MRVKEVNLGRESETKNEHVGISSGTSNTVCTVLTSATGMEKTDIATRMESIESETLFRIPESCLSRSVEVVVDQSGLEKDAVAAGGLRSRFWLQESRSGMKNGSRGVCVSEQRRDVVFFLGPQ